MNNGFLTYRDLELMGRLAREGRSRGYIAAAVGCSPSTVSRNVAGLFDRRKRLQRAREDRMMRVYETAEMGDREWIASRFGFASVEALHVAVHRIRRRNINEKESAR